MRCRSAKTTKGNLALSPVCECRYTRQYGSTTKSVWKNQILENYEKRVEARGCNQRIAEIILMRGDRIDSIKIKYSDLDRRYEVSEQIGGTGGSERRFAIAEGDELVQINIWDQISYGDQNTIRGIQFVTRENKVSPRYGGRVGDVDKGVLSEVKLYNSSYHFSGFIAHIGRYFGTSQFWISQTDEIRGLKFLMVSNN